MQDDECWMLKSVHLCITPQIVPCLLLKIPCNRLSQEPSDQYDDHHHHNNHHGDDYHDDHNDHNDHDDHDDHNDHDDHDYHHSSG